MPAAPIHVDDVTQPDLDRRLPAKPERLALFSREDDRGFSQGDRASSLKRQIERVESGSSAGVVKLDLGLHRHSFRVEVFAASGCVRIPRTLHPISVLVRSWKDKLRHSALTAVNRRALVFLAAV